MTGRPEVALRVTRNGRDRELVAAVQDVFKQSLVLLPASSVAVERLHANTQLNSVARCDSAELIFDVYIPRAQPYQEGG